jgi:murein DD-endopeptidase MepM/ murein hydrolase activator NlpD
MLLRYKKIFALFLSVLLGGAFFAYAATSGDIQNQINEKARQIQALQEEIKKYEQSLDQTSTKARSLQNELNALTTSKKKLETELRLTEVNLSKTSSTIQVISGQIIDTEERIKQDREYLAATIRGIAHEDDTSLIQTFLSTKNLSDVSDYIVAAEKLSEALQGTIKDLYASEEILSNQKTSAETKKAELAKLKTNLSGQQKAIADTAKETNKLLTNTKGEEATYQRILSDKKALMEQFEKELFDYQSNLGITVNAKGFPSAKKGILSWPLKTIRITQQFGKTAFSGRLYASGTHNGTDFGASDGTAIMASLGGKVRALGNTDLKKNCYSYGKWVLVDHPNGLATLYTHLSSVVVSPGDTVQTGDIIAYSGRTGYVTGPHLHLTLLVSASTEVMQYPPEKAVNCGGVTIPIAPPTAFLDPMAYLPSL